MTKRAFSFLGSFIAVAAILGTAGLWHANRAQASTTVSSGDLIRGTSFSAVYYMGADGFRYVFPNDKTYFTWYSNFDTVKVLSDSDLAKIQMGGNVTYKPGSKMIKINSDPKTYAISAGGVLRHVTSESIAVSLYGSTWNTKIDDVPDGFFSNYSIGHAIETSSAYSSTTEAAAATSINTDKALTLPGSISITSNGYSPIDVTVSAGETVKFTNTDTEKHTATADDLSWGTGTMEAGGTFTHRFTEAGTYTFFDSYDSGNTGAIYVE